MTIARDARIGRGYIAREGDTGSVIWATSRDAMAISKGTSRVSVAGRPGQLVFYRDQVPVGVVPPGTAITTPTTLTVTITGWQQFSNTGHDIIGPYPPQVFTCTYNGVDTWTGSATADVTGVMIRPCYPTPPFAQPGFGSTTSITVVGATYVIYNTAFLNPSEAYAFLYGSHERVNAHAGPGPYGCPEDTTITDYATVTIS